MATEGNKLEVFGTVIRNLVTALRDSVVFFLFVLLLFTPTTIRDRLVEAGFTKGSIAGFEWGAQLESAAEQTKSIGESVEQASENYSSLIERLNKLEQEIADPEVKATVKSIEKEAQKSSTKLKAADRSVRHNFAVQQQLVAKIRPSAVTKAGWLYLGKVTQDKTAWVAGSPKHIQSTSPALLSGKTLTVIDDVYLRERGTVNGRPTRGKILGAAKEGDAVEVIELDYSRARGGGWFVWVKVQQV